jgi:hypothetical protein
MQGKAKKQGFNTSAYTPLSACGQCHSAARHFNFGHATCGAPSMSAHRAACYGYSLNMRRSAVLPARFASDTVAKNSFECATGLRRPAL